MAFHLSKGEWTWARHLDFLSQKLCDLATGRIKRLLVSMPPGFGKSYLTSMYFPVWYLENFRQNRIILASYEAEFAAKWGKKARNLILENQKILGSRLCDDSQAADNWELKSGGSMMTAGIGGPCTGNRANLLIADDPHKNQEEANSLVFQEKAWEWFDSTFMTRLQPGGSAVVVATRWHEHDLIGRILENVEERGAQPWEVIRFPAIAEHEDVLGRKPGEGLWPERFSDEEMAQIKADRTDYVWASLYQQEPPSKTGNPVYAFDPVANVDPNLKIVPNLPLQIGIDFNREPGMHMEVGQYFPDEDLVGVTHEIHGPRMTIRQMIAAFRRLIDSQLGGWQWTEVEVFGDASGWQTSCGDSKSNWDWVREELKVQGIPFMMRVPHRNPGRQDRVNRMNYAMKAADGKVRLKIHPRCRLLERDFKRMRWNGNDFSQKDKKLSHCSDALGYRVNGLLPIRKGMKYHGKIVLMGGAA